jgi:DNA-binding NtrC family response regulator
MRVLPVDVRIIAATNRNLEQLVAAGQFREDLFYRLHVFVLELPPLRERKDDIRQLADCLLHKHAGTAAEGSRGFTDEAYKTLEQYDWPGNIRELENAVECTVIRAEGSAITKADLPVKIRGQAGAGSRQAKRLPAISPAEELERQAIAAALQLFGFTVEGKKQAAAHLGMGIATLYRKLKRYNL